MSPASTTTLERLRGVAGGASVSTDSAQLEAFRVDGMQPAAVVRPATAEGVAEVVRFAAAEKLGVVPVGGRTKLGIGMPPTRYDLALDMTGLNRVIAYDPNDLTLSVEVGLRLAELTPMLAEHKQFLPLAVPFTRQTTIGGTIATGVDSPLRQFYGTARDYVLGIEFVTGAGVLTKSGGRVVKNVAGYDLHKLMIGALGTLGVITRVNFKTFPLPPASCGFVAAFPNFEAALEMRKRVLESPLQPLTLEVLSPALAQIFHCQAPTTLGEALGPVGTWLSTSEWTLTAGFGGREPVLERYATELTRLAAESCATNTAVLDDTDRPLLWGRLRECFPMLLETSPLATIFKIGALSSQLGRVLNTLRLTLERHSLPLVTLVRGAGLTYVALLPTKPGPEGLQQLADAVTPVFEVGAGLAEHVTIPWCPTELKRRINVWGPPRRDHSLLVKMKQTFDPQNILNPGRYVGGL